MPDAPTPPGRPQVTQAMEDYLKAVYRLREGGVQVTTQRLAEARAGDPWELVVVAHAPAETRRERMTTLRGMTDEDAAARLAAQVSDDARLAIADVVIDTSGSLDDTIRQADELWAELPAHLARRAAGA